MVQELKNHSNNIYIAYPVTLPAGSGYIRDDLHCTIAFFGEIDEHTAPKELIVDTLSCLNTNIEQSVDVEKFEGFGIAHDINVMVLYPTSFLMEMNEVVVEMMAGIGMKANTDFPYRPHVTVPETFRFLPAHVLLHPAELWYGGEHIVIGNAGIDS